MLVVRLNYKTESGVFPVLSKYGFQFKGNAYEKNLKSAAFSVVMTHKNDEKVLEAVCEDEISFDGCKELYALIAHLSEHLQAEVDDKEAMLGYDSEGRPAYLYHGFTAWREFINKAKHRSMEGFTVEVFDGKKLLGRGILIQSDVSSRTKQGQKQTPFCTIISSEGEETFLGDHLNIIPVTDETGFNI
ncbi:hypothetical protein K8O68_21100 [Salipaludibacillus sp. CUR1]|uniref:hypothetical protein n=1 Tax=Salipaludibacillus sp. CUR1 TaxID=2820003 RepID=UPI001E4E9393|nr:hypothetical protein [Salipaludibacillus sp. CUR1]MCE7794890.1 hypothetical protein [Salipaludibacillus sp. CUR1]